MGLYACVIDGCLKASMKLNRLFIRIFSMFKSLTLISIGGWLFQSIGRGASISCTWNLKITILFSSLMKSRTEDTLYKNTGFSPWTSNWQLIVLISSLSCPTSSVTWSKPCSDETIGTVAWIGIVKLRSSDVSYSLSAYNINIIPPLEFLSLDKNYTWDVFY